MTLLHAQLHAGEAAWPHLLNIMEVDYVTLDYDYVTRRLPRSVRYVADFVGVDLPGDEVPAGPALSRQADAATEVFITQWRHETGGCPACADDDEPCGTPSG